MPSPFLNSGEVKQGVWYNSAFRLAGWFLGKQFLEEKSGGKPVGGRSQGV